MYRIFNDTSNPGMDDAPVSRLDSVEGNFLSEAFPTLEAAADFCRKYLERDAGAILHIVDDENRVVQRICNEEFRRYLEERDKGDRGRDLIAWLVLVAIAAAASFWFLPATLAGYMAAGLAAFLGLVIWVLGAKSNLFLLFMVIVMGIAAAKLVPRLPW